MTGAMSRMSRRWGQVENENMSVSIQYFKTASEEATKKDAVNFIIEHVLMAFQFAEWGVSVMDHDLKLKGANKSRTRSNEEAIHGFCGQAVVLMWDKFDIQDHCTTCKYIGLIQKFTNSGRNSNNKNVIVLLMPGADEVEIGFALSDSVPKAKFLRFSKSVEFCDQLHEMIYKRRRKPKKAWRYENAIKARDFNSSASRLLKTTNDEESTPEVTYFFDTTTDGQPETVIDVQSTPESTELLDIITDVLPETVSDEHSTPESTNLLDTITDGQPETAIDAESTTGSSNLLDVICSDLSCLKDGNDRSHQMLHEILGKLDKNLHLPPIDAKLSVFTDCTLDKERTKFFTKIVERIRVRTRRFLRTLIPDSSIIDEVERIYGEEVRREELNTEVLYKCLCYWDCVSKQAGDSREIRDTKLNEALEVSGNPALKVQEMDERLKRVLNINRPYLADELCDIEGLCIHLQSLGIIEDTHKFNVLGRSTTMSQVDYLVDILLTREQRCYFDLLKFLADDEGQKHVSDKLIMTEMNLDSLDEEHHRMDIKTESHGFQLQSHETKTDEDTILAAPVDDVLKEIKLLRNELKYCRHKITSLEAGMTSLKATNEYLDRKNLNLEAENVRLRDENSWLRERHTWKKQVDKTPPVMNLLRDVVPVAGDVLGFISDLAGGSGEVCSFIGDLCLM